MISDCIPIKSFTPVALKISVEVDLNTRVDETVEVKLMNLLDFMKILFIPYIKT